MLKKSIKLCRPTIFIGDSEGFYEGPKQELLKEKVGDLFFWCNSLGEINLPGKYEDAVDVSDHDVRYWMLPPEVRELYDTVQEDGYALYCYTVSFRGHAGILLNLLIDEGFYKEKGVTGDQAYEAIITAARRIQDEDTLLPGCDILAMEGTAPDGHELAVFVEKGIATHDYIDRLASWLSETGYGCVVEAIDSIAASNAADN